MPNYKSATVNEIYLKGGDKNGETGSQLIKCVTYGTLCTTDWHNPHNCFYENTTGFDYSDVSRVAAINDVKIYDSPTPPEPRKVQFMFNSAEEEFKAIPFLVFRGGWLKDHPDATTEVSVIEDGYTRDNGETFAVNMYGSPTELLVTYGHEEYSAVIDGQRYYYPSTTTNIRYFGKNGLPNKLIHLEDYDIYNLNLYCPILDFSLYAGGYSNVNGKRIVVIASANELSMSQYVSGGYRHPWPTTKYYAMGWGHKYGVSDDTYDEFVSYEPDEYEGTDYTIYPILKYATGYVTSVGFGIVFSDPHTNIYYERAAVVIKEDIYYEDCYVVIKLKNFIL